MPRRLTDVPHAAFIIEVICEDHDTWTAMATEWGGIVRELRTAPPCITITIYEWRLGHAINPQPAMWQSKYPSWSFVGVSPWSLIKGDA